ncbi:GNAT family N-acetyltransferase [Thaumasiovibrio sp. DFM-14]|uniref:GNAT family N-acetyltransferase n=1 Tax=Thaumasiovibrio sp. DFM-14 TaxID=3384792 RepID=UPI0039A234DA
MEWKTRTFSQLTTAELYQLMQLRVDVFVVEQQCPYHELDGHDMNENVFHLLGYQDGKLSAYLRVLDAGVTYDNASIGRVIVAPHARGQQLGFLLVQKGIEIAQQQLNTNDIKIGAQHALVDFYAALGFKASSEPYLEDGIPHIDMQLTLKKQE